MCITTLMASICMLLVWRLHPIIPFVFWLVLTFVEGIFLTSVLYKVHLLVLPCTRTHGRGYIFSCANSKATLTCTGLPLAQLSRNFMSISGSVGSENLKLDRLSAWPCFSGVDLCLYLGTSGLFLLWRWSAAGTPCLCLALVTRHTLSFLTVQATPLLIFIQSMPKFSTNQLN